MLRNQTALLNNTDQKIQKQNKEYYISHMVKHKSRTYFTEQKNGRIMRQYTCERKDRKAPESTARFVSGPLGEEVHGVSQTYITKLDRNSNGKHQLIIPAPYM